MIRAHSITGVMALIICVASFSWIVDTAFGEPLNAERLKAVWKNVTAIEARMDQIKRGPHFTRPLNSKVALTWTPETTVWKVLEPNQATMVMSKGTSTGVPGAGPDNTQIAMIAELIEDIVTVDIEALQRRFTITFGENDLSAVAIGEISPVRNLKIAFDKGLMPSVMTIVTKAEETELRFRSIKTTKAKSAP